MALAKLGLGFLFILFLGLVYFPNPTASAGNSIPMHRFSCLGVEHDYQAYPPPPGEREDPEGGYRRTIGSGPFYKSNPKMWGYYDLGPGIGHWNHDNAGVPMQVDLYWIKVDGRFLNGWVHVVVKATGPPDWAIGILQLHGIVDYGDFKNSGEDINWPKVGRGGFGEFVHDFPSCTDDEHKEDLKLTKYQFMPCGGLLEKGQTMPWGFQYVERMEETDFGYLVPSGKHREFHMNFRFSTQPCDHPWTIRFAAIAYFPDGTNSLAILGDKLPTHRWRFAITDDFDLTDNHVVGASDPVPRPGTFTNLDCSTRITNSSSAPKFVKKVNHNRSVRAFEHACTEAATYKYFEKDDPYYGETSLFGGRCIRASTRTRPYQDRASTTRINECNPNTAIEDPSTGKTAIEYHEHVANITTNIASLCAPCPTVPPRPVTTERTSSTTASRPTGAPKEDFTIEELAELKRGVELTGSMAFGIWDTRLLHGVCMTILSIFVSPINIFITRYFKETFMDTRIMFLRLWYFVHHSAMMASAILYGAGLWRIVSRRVLAGVSLSLSATVHRSLGWVSIAIVILLALLGGFRPIERKLRTYVIAAHWTAGMTIYFMNYALMINSVWIPASPSAWVESSDDSLGKLVVPVLVIVWILFDVVMHLLMTIHVCNMDKRLGLTRPRYWLPVPISVLPEDETRDLIGSSHRKKMLIVYGVVALVVTVVICCLLGTSDPKGRGLGFMSCTHYGHGEYWQEMGKKRC